MRKLVPATVGLVALLGGVTVGTQSWGAGERDTSTAARSSVRSPSAAAFRAFQADSWWNTPVPARAPKSPIKKQILAYMRSGPDAGGGCVRLAGTGTNKWGQPVYWAAASDPEYDVHVSGGDRPRELGSLRIPAEATAADTSDAAMTVFDRQRGYVVALTGAHYSASAGWSARGATVTYLDSNGLHSRLKRSNDQRNRGSHRGNNGATMMVRYDEVAAGAIRHVLKVSSGPETSGRWAFPMVGSDGDSTDPVAPREGLRFRIKPSVDLTALHLNPQAYVIARALQRYGMYLGDNGGHTTLKLEDTRATGQGQKWTLSSTALCRLPLTPKYWTVIKGGYDPSR
jgi:hypothetical protein